MRGSFARVSGGVLGIAFLLSLFVGQAVAGGIINKQNQSADYMRTLNRNAATDYADIVSYNPAGIMQMEDGAYGKSDVMYLDKDYSNDVPGFGELDQNKPSITPGIFSVYKQDKVAGFFGFTIPAGGGKLDYKDGNARTFSIAQDYASGLNEAYGTNYYPSDLGELEVKRSSVYGLTAGAAFAINDAWSVALGARYATGKREFKGQASVSTDGPAAPEMDKTETPKVHLDEEADGLAGILGVNYAPNDKFNAALTYISNTRMNYEIDVKEDTHDILPSMDLADGSKRRIDIPGLLGAGVSYRFLPELKVDVNYTYYLEKDATIDQYEDEGNSWDLGISAEYTFNPEWKASVGYLRTEIKLADNQQIEEPEEPKLDANTLGAGLVWSPTQSWDITFGGAYIMYDGVEDDRGIEYDKTVWNLSAGVQYKFF